VERRFVRLGLRFTTIVTAQPPFTARSLAQYGSMLAGTRWRSPRVAANLEEM